MAQMAGVQYTTVNDDVPARLAGLKARQDAVMLGAAIKAIDAALTGPRVRDGSVNLDPRAAFHPPIRGIDVGAWIALAAGAGKPPTEPPIL